MVLGPTGVGKTDLALKLATRLGVPIISADSRQLYKHLHIGTAAPSPQQLAQVRHFFVHCIEPDQRYSAAQYEQDVLALLEQLLPAHDVALMVGGSMLYIDAVCQGLDDLPTINEALRRTLQQRLATEGLPALYKQLQLLDPPYAAEVDAKNPRRILHALEICLQTGQTVSALRGHRAERKRPFRVVKIGLTRPRDALFQRINRRVDQMVAQGLMQEAQALLPLRHLNALNTVGYKEMFRVLDGEWPLEMAIERIKKHTRVYAKKQLTWFAHDETIHWIDLDATDEDQALTEIIDVLREEVGAAKT